MNGRCKERVWNGQFSDYPCSRKDWKDGYCKQHHPDSVKKRRDDAYAKFTAKMAAVAETQYQAKLAEDTALQDQQRWQREEIARLRLENERLREAERDVICDIVYGLCISDNNAQEIVNAIRARGSK
jgi:predicted phosphohydrolase